VEDQVYEW
jgi:hypothetical protein